MGILWFQNWKAEFLFAESSMPRPHSTIRTETSKSISVRRTASADLCAAATSPRIALMPKVPRPFGIIVPSELNNTIWKAVSGGVHIKMPDQSDLQARAWGNFETFHSNNHGLTSPPSRNGSRLTLMQRVPTNDTGGMVQWSKAFGSRNFVTVGTDWRWVDGDSLEQAMNTASTAVATDRISGGTQISTGVFVQDLISVTKQFQLTLSARMDHWKNYDAHNLQTAAATGLPIAANRPSCNVDNTVPCLADKKNTVGNPRVGAVYHLTDSLSVWSSISWGFRAPTLNELYRQFAVGSTTTLANDQLGPERLTSGEGGVTYAPVHNLTWRSAWFVNKFTNPVSNVTIATGANHVQSNGRTWAKPVSGAFKVKWNTGYKITGASRWRICTTSQKCRKPSRMPREFPLPATTSRRFP